MPQRVKSYRRGEMPTIIRTGTATNTLTMGADTIPPYYWR